MNNSSDYSYDFYKNRHSRTVYSAQTILGKVYKVLPALHSVADLGCGVGTWLATAKQLGAATVTGFDGPWVDKQLLEISSNEFIEANLSNAVETATRYDLAISLEVAEHIPAEHAETFVSSLTRLSDFVLFSAAFPLQGGKNHVNEQWPDYWISLFRQQGYTVLDFLRAEIWDDEQIPFWYKQNILFFVRNERMNDLTLPDNFAPGTFPVSRIIHPDAYSKKHMATVKLSSLRGSFKAFRKSLKRAIFGKT